MIGEPTCTRCGTMSAYANRRYLPDGTSVCVICYTALGYSDDDDNDNDEGEE